MDIKEWLNRGRNLNTEIEALQEARQKAFHLACMAGGTPDDVKVQTSRENKIEKNLLTLVEYDRRLRLRMNELYHILEEISRAVEDIPDSTLRTLLIERYINCKTWEQVAEDMGYSDKWVRGRLHLRALNEIKIPDSSL